MLDRDTEAIEAFELALGINPGLSNMTNVLQGLKRRAAQAQRKQGEGGGREGSGGERGSGADGVQQ